MLMVNRRILCIGVFTLVSLWMEIRCTGTSLSMFPVDARLANELSTVDKFVDVARANHSDTMLLFACSNGDGFSLYRKSLITGVSLEVFHQSEATYNAGFRILGWSLDDAYYAYMKCANCLELVTASSGAVHEQMFPLPGIKDGLWISNNTLVVEDHHRVLYEVTRTGSNWSSRPFACWRVQSQGAWDNIDIIRRYDRRSVAWLSEGSLWTCAADELVPTKVLDIAAVKIKLFDYSEAANRFLVWCSRGRREFLATYEPHTKTFAELESVDVATKAEIPDWLANLALVNDGRGYVYSIRLSSGVEILKVHPDESGRVVELTWEGLIRAFSANDQNSYITASRNFEPTAIWRLNTALGKMGLAVGNRAHFQVATCVQPTSFELEYPDGTHRCCDLYTPTRNPVSQKAPLVIGSARIGYEQAVVNAGAYFACVHRYVTEGNENVDFELVRKKMLNCRGIDEKKIYLMCTSRGTLPVMELLETNRNKWAGAIILSPNYVPALDGISGVRLLIDQGAVDREMHGDGFTYMRREVGDARRLGLEVYYNIQEGAGHFYRSHIAERSRVEDIMRFLVRP